MRRLLRTVVCGAAIAGVIGAAPAVVSAAPSSFADRSVTRTTEDGWQVSAVKAKERVRSVPPLNQSPWTREGFVTLRGEGRIGGAGRVPVDAGQMSFGLQIGCNTDVTSGVTIGVMGGPTAQMSISYPPALIVGAQVLPNISTTLKPGVIADVPFGSKRLAGPKAGITIDGVHIKVDGCLGPVALRAYTRVAISTRLNDDTIHAYGQPHYL